MPIVVATITKIQDVELLNSQNRLLGCHFSLKIQELLYQGNLIGSPEIKITDYNAQSQNNWGWLPGSRKPENGTKVMVYLKKSSKGTWDIAKGRSSVRVLQDFEAPIIDATRKAVSLWKIASPADRLNAVLSGCEDSNTQFQSICIQSLWRTDGGLTGVELSGVLTREMALSHLWQIYSARSTDLSTVKICDRGFLGLYRGSNWATYPPRFDIVRAAVENAIESDQSSKTILAMTRYLCYYPEHTQENFQLLLRLISKDVEQYATAANFFSLLYQPYTTSPEVQQLNRNLLAELDDMLTRDHYQLGMSASVALADIAFNCAQLGIVPKTIKDLLLGDHDTGNGKMRESFLRSLKQGHAHRAKTLVYVEKPNETRILAYPWKELLGENVFIVASSNPGYSRERTSVNFDRVSITLAGRRFELSDAENLPYSMNTPCLVAIRGTLKLRNDVAVFRYQEGKPFRGGMPVPDGFSLEKTRQRYVLENVSWKIVDGGEKGSGVVD